MQLSNGLYIFLNKQYANKPRYCRQNTQNNWAKLLRSRYKMYKLSDWRHELSFVRVCVCIFSLLAKKPFRRIANYTAELGRVFLGEREREREKIECSQQTWHIHLAAISAMENSSTGERGREEEERCQVVGSFPAFSKNLQQSKIAKKPLFPLR